MDTQETALHTCITSSQYVYIRRNRLRAKIKRVVHMLNDCLPLQNNALQTPLHAVAIKLISGTLSDYYAEFLQEMVTKAQENPEKTAEILNARDQHGNTVLHYLAQCQLGLVAIPSVIEAGGNTTIRNKDKLTPLDIVSKDGTQGVIKALDVALRKCQPSSGHGNNVVYTADSPPQSPVNLGENEEDWNESLNSTLHCSDNSSFDNNANLESDNVPSVTTKDAVSGTSVSESSSVIVDDALYGDTNYSPSHATSIATGVVPSNVDLEANKVCSVMSKDSPSDTSDEVFSAIAEYAPSGTTKNVICITGDVSSAFLADVPSNADLEADNACSVVPKDSPSDIAEEVPSAIANDAPSGDTNNDPSSITDDAALAFLTDVPSNTDLEADDGCSIISKDAPSDTFDEFSSVVAGCAPCGDTNDAHSCATCAASVLTGNYPPGINDETPPADELPCDDRDDATSEPVDDVLPFDSDEAPSCDPVETSLQRECGCTGIRLLLSLVSVNCYLVQDNVEQRTVLRPGLKSSKSL